MIEEFYRNSRTNTIKNKIIQFDMKTHETLFRNVHYILGDGVTQTKTIV